MVKDLSVLAHSFSSTPKDQWEENVMSFRQRASMQQQMAEKHSVFFFFFYKKKNSLGSAVGGRKHCIATVWLLAPGRNGAEINQHVERSK